MYNSYKKVEYGLVNNINELTNKLGSISNTTKKLEIVGVIEKMIMVLEKVSKIKLKTLSFMANEDIASFLDYLEDGGVIDASESALSVAEKRWGMADIFEPESRLVDDSNKDTKNKDTSALINSKENTSSFLPSTKPKRYSKPGQPRVRRKSHSKKQGVIENSFFVDGNHSNIQKQGVIENSFLVDGNRSNTQKEVVVVTKVDKPELIVSGYSWGDGFYGKEYYGVDTKTITNNNNVLVTKDGLVDATELIDNSELSLSATFNSSNLSSSSSSDSPSSDSFILSNVSINELQDEFALDDISTLDDYWDI